MSHVYFALIGAVLLALVSTAGDYFMNLAGEGKKFMEVKWFAAGIIVYLITSFLWFFLMKHFKLSTLGVFYAISTILSLTILSVIVFHEPLNRYEFAGIILAAAALILLCRFA